MIWVRRTHGKIRQLRCPKNGGVKFLKNVEMRFLQNWSFLAQFDKVISSVNVPKAEIKYYKGKYVLKIAFHIAGVLGFWGNATTSRRTAATATETTWSDMSSPPMRLGSQSMSIHLGACCNMTMALAKISTSEITSSECCRSISSILSLPPPELSPRVRASDPDHLQSRDYSYQVPASHWDTI